MLFDMFGLCSIICGPPTCLRTHPATGFSIIGVSRSIWLYYSSSNARFAMLDDGMERKKGKMMYCQGYIVSVE